MPELPEVHTTATMLDKFVKNKRILDVWTDYKSTYHTGRPNIKDPKYFSRFRKEVSGKKILRVHRRAKNVLLDLEDGQTILIHMKMTGHLLYSQYIFDKKKNSWSPKDKNGLFAGPFSRFVHLVFSLSDGKHMAFSDMRKFASVSLIPDPATLKKTFEKVGPEPLEKTFTWQTLRARLLLRPKGKIKTVLMDHNVVAGIGNIYSDEILWAARIHPERRISTLSETDFREILKWIKKLLAKGIDFGGDSMSDYRNPLGERGDFQNHHNVYRRKNLPCLRKRCPGTIQRKVIGQRSAHFCPVCQK
ncbi:MAG: DNA-formamidopyrimidine glycosylase [Candidatus Pacebacteria bacterium]|nr:DNA-formamidopyrimidine glycosylase [Candidatus Paceibacterota bacterium]